MQAIKIYSYYLKYHEGSSSPHNPRDHVSRQRLGLNHSRHSRCCLSLHLQRHQIRTVSVLLSRINKVIPTLVNKTAAAALTHDLNNPTHQTMTGIDVATWKQIYTYFGVPGQNCSKTGQTYISGSGLTCLNVLWKYFVPLNGCT